MPVDLVPPLQRHRSLLHVLQLMPLLPVLLCCMCCMCCCEAWSFTLVLLRTPVAFLSDTSLLRLLGVQLRSRFVLPLPGVPLQLRFQLQMLPLLGVLRRMLYRYCNC
jgi:hypothetical protein